MSNHDIGYAFGELVEVLLEEYDEGKFDRDTVVRLIDICGDIVGEHDGNVYEMFEDMDEERCGTCLRKDVEVFEFDWEDVKEGQGFQNFNDCICKDCAKKYGIKIEIEK